jgi:hypothetical protein
LEYLKGAHQRKISELCDQNFLAAVGPGLASIYRANLEELKKINIDDLHRGKKFDFAVKIFFFTYH